MGSDDAILYAMDIFPSGKTTLRKYVDTLFTRITRLSVATSLTDEELYLVLDEAISNAMEHGNGWDDKKAVTVTTSLDAETLTITIRDQGKGYPEAPNYDNQNPLQSRRGRGLFLIPSFCPVARNALGNELRVSIKRTGHQP